MNVGADYRRHYSAIFLGNQNLEMKHGVPLNFTSSLKRGKQTFVDSHKDLFKKKL